jgi:hypothetical protein
MPKMKVYRKGTGEKYTPFDHYNMTTQVIFNPEGGCNKANITLSTVPKGAGSHDEIHGHSDQSYVLKGTARCMPMGSCLQRQEGTLFHSCGETYL